MRKEQRIYPPFVTFQQTKIKSVNCFHPINLPLQAKTGNNEGKKESNNGNEMKAKCKQSDNCSKSANNLVVCICEG